MKSSARESRAHDPGFQEVPGVLRTSRACWLFRPLRGSTQPCSHGLGLTTPRPLVPAHLPAQITITKERTTVVGDGSTAADVAARVKQIRNLQMQTDQVCVCVCVCIVCVCVCVGVCGG